MVKSDLILALSNKQDFLPYRDVELSINQILESMSKALSNGERIEIRSFGSFSLHYRPPRNAHNPRTGARVATVDKYRPHFKPGKELRERVNQRFLDEAKSDTVTTKAPARQEELVEA